MTNNVILKIPRACWEILEERLRLDCLTAPGDPKLREQLNASLATVGEIEPQVAIFVSAGVVYAVLTNAVEIKVQVIDGDNIKRGGEADELAPAGMIITDPQAFAGYVGRSIEQFQAAGAETEG